MRINLYPENYQVFRLPMKIQKNFDLQYTGHLILTLILMILGMLVICLFKLAASLEMIDKRLSNIENMFKLN